MTHMYNHEMQQQLKDSLELLKIILGSDLLGVYLYGSSLVGGLQKYSDIDLFVVSNRKTTPQEKTQLIAHLLQISGIYMKSSKPPIELTIVEKAAINPWQYPPHFDFQYGEWFRESFEQGITRLLSKPSILLSRQEKICEEPECTRTYMRTLSKFLTPLESKRRRLRKKSIQPWPTHEMHDLALIITQVLLKSQTLCGPEPTQLLPHVPYHDFMKAMLHDLNRLATDLDHDTRNVLLTYARIWSTSETNTIRSKPAAADWAINHLPKPYQPVIKRAKSICIGLENEYWNDIKALIKPCADFMVNKINTQTSSINFDDPNNSIKLAEEPFSKDMKKQKKFLLSLTDPMN